MIGILPLIIKKTRPIYNRAGQKCGNNGPGGAGNLPRGFAAGEMEPNGDKRRGFAVGDPARRSRDGDGKRAVRGGKAMAAKRTNRTGSFRAAKRRARFCAANPKGGADDRPARFRRRRNGAEWRQAPWFCRWDPARRSRDGTAKERCGVAKPWPRSGQPHRVVSRGETPRPILRKSPQSPCGQRAARTGLVTARRAFTACFCARPWACPFPRGGSCAQKCAPSPPRPEAAAGSCPSAKGQSAPPARARRPAAAHNSA